VLVVVWLAGVARELEFGMGVVVLRAIVGVRMRRTLAGGMDFLRTMHVGVRVEMAVRVPVLMAVAVAVNEIAVAVFMLVLVRMRVGMGMLMLMLV
jgi:hypothetical protein